MEFTFEIIGKTFTMTMKRTCESMSINLAQTVMKFDEKLSNIEFEFRAIIKTQPAFS